MGHHPLVSNEAVTGAVSSGMAPIVWIIIGVIILAALAYYLTRNKK